MEDGRVEGSDSFRLYRGKCSEEIGETILLPNSSAQEMVKLEPTEYSSSGEWVHFRNGDGTIISCRTFKDDKFPVTDKILKMGKRIELVLPKLILESIEKAQVFAKRDHWVDESVIINIEESKIFVEAQNDAGKFQDSLNMRYKGDPIGFMISPNLLKSILKETNIAELDDVANKIKFKGVNWEYVAMLKI